MRIRSADDQIKTNLIAKLRTGSWAYGMNIEGSDIDYRGIFCADMINVVTPFFTVGQKIETEGDETTFELSKFMKLYIECNPNILELLWVDESDIIVSSPEYLMLRSERQNLLCSKLAFTFSGYAISQIQRIRGHNRWLTQSIEGLNKLRQYYKDGLINMCTLEQYFDEETLIKVCENNPQTAQYDESGNTKLGDIEHILADSQIAMLTVKGPRQANFVSLVYNMSPDKIFKIALRDYREGYCLKHYDGNVYGLYEMEGQQTFNDDLSLKVYDEAVGKVPLMIVKFNKAEHQLASDDHNNYWQWKRNRNTKRSELEEKYGMDTKHASHCVRLVRMGLEALQTGQINVRRPDAQDLLDIRHGKWTYDELLEYAQHMDHEIRDVWYKKTDLPKKPNYVLAAQLLMKIQQSFWSKH